MASPYGLLYEGAKAPSCFPLVMVRLAVVACWTRGLGVRSSDWTVLVMYPAVCAW